MNENVKWIAAAIAVVGLTVGGILYVSRSKKAPAPAAPPVAATTPEPMPAEDPIKHPVPATAAQEKLPPLDESDAPIQGALRDLLGNEPVEKFVVPEELVRHIVVTIDNLPEQKVAQRLRPVRPVPGMFIAGGSEDEPLLDPTNYARYVGLVQVFKSTDTARLVAAYQRYYPLFQDAYANLGHPPQYFNDRVIEVIDHLLATPDLPGQVALKRPGVLYEYADPNVESLSAGQKLLVRMGEANATAVKQKLKELRTALASLPAN
jgi:hypothetical protein